MCATCGCEGVVHAHDEQADVPEDHDHGHEHHGHHREHEHRDHDHGHEHHGRHHHAPPPGGTVSELVRFERALLEKNARLAAENRRFFAGHGVLALNLMSSPGAGKTTLLESAIGALIPRHDVLVIEGDQATDNDAARIRAAGARAVQINTGAGCHLDAHMVFHAASELEPQRGALLFIENVGNLVCPALFDLGEALRAVVVSVTEGEDKPLKYPHMFRSSDVLIVNKIDLLPYVACDVERLIRNARRVKPGLRVFRLSAVTGAGLAEFCAFVGGELAALDSLAARPQARPEST
ncbi:MAG TPA: hydrogenase nickel incorporation protein HypB [Polyangiaceae bacterium]